MKAPMTESPTGSMVSIQFKKRADGAAALSCTRANGTATWQRQQGVSAKFFPKHDLTHFAVESVLRVRDGFYGLIAQGWDIEDFGTPWPRGRLPEPAEIVELIVGMLDLERATASRYSAAEYREKVAAWYSARGVAREIALEDDQLASIRKVRDELFARLDATAPGESLKLEFVLPEQA
jgi:hypothetical protein